MIQSKFCTIVLISLVAALVCIAAGITPTPQPSTITPTEPIPVNGTENITLIIIGAFLLVIIITAGVAWNFKLHNPHRQGVGKT
jgi:heme/copper-type cytochrome/quinol oxidase subunit 2